MLRLAPQMNCIKNVIVLLPLCASFKLQLFALSPDSSLPIGKPISVSANLGTIATNAHPCCMYNNYGKRHTQQHANTATKWQRGKYSGMSTTKTIQACHIYRIAGKFLANRHFGEF